MKFLAPSVISVCLLFSGIGAGQAQVTIDMAKYTCDDLAHADIGERVINAAWFSGFVNGRKNNTKIDEKKLIIHLWFFDIKSGKIFTYSDEERKYQAL